VNDLRMTTTFKHHPAIRLEKAPLQEKLPSGAILSSFSDSKLESTSDCLLFLHGFPSLRSRQNLDLAEAATQEFHRKSFIPHYRGLGVSPGRFFFESSLVDAREALSNITKKFSKVHLIGHSWGGAVALNLLKEHPTAIASLTLLSPLLDFEITDASIIALAREVRSDYPSLFASITEAEQIEDAKIIHKAHRPILWMSDVKKVPLLVFQATHDPYTPKEKTILLVQAWDASARYLEIDLDHSFLNDRPLFKKTFLKELDLQLKRISS